MKKSRFLEKRLKKNLVYEGKSVNFRVDDIQLPNSKRAVREFMDHPGAVAVLPVDQDGRLVFVSQYRYPVGKETLEVPAGKLNGKNDDLLLRVRAELREETGYTAAKIEHLLDFWPTPAFSNEILRIYLATGLKPGKKQPDEDEFLATRKLRPEEALRMVRKGRIKDSKTIIALFYYELFIKQRKNRF